MNKAEVFRASRNLFVVLPILLSAGCAAYGYDDYGDYDPERRRHHDRDHDRGYVPDGHLPPPGECRGIPTGQRGNNLPLAIAVNCADTFSQADV